MSLSRRAFRQRRGQRDSNHATIADGLRKLGHHVIDLAGAGDGVPDLCVYPNIRCARLEPIWLELKVAKGTLRASQVAWQDAATSRGVRVSVVRSLDEALRAIEGGE